MVIAKASIIQQSIASAPMLHISKSSRIRNCSVSLKCSPHFLPHLRTFAKSVPKSSKPFDFVNFDPQTNPNEASAIYTSLGWFYVPLKHNTDKQPRILLDKEFTRNKFTDATNREQIQQFIYNWCQGYTPNVYKKKVSYKAESEQKKLDKLFRQQMTDKVHIDKHVKCTKEAQRLNNKANGGNDKLRFRINSQTGDVEIRGVLKMTSVFNYYLQKQTRAGQVDANTKESPSTSRQIRQKISKQWNELSQDDKDAIKREYWDVLLRGKDYHLGKEVDLESRLGDAISEDGFRYKTSKKMDTKRKKKEEEEE
ncbi:hypothetical protein CORT_0F02140 [Candida orthopsilosis Co 90-125]|uniref:Uncharacterized protein n=1 Tax=Candida orthopsilosis (strain 90-125) TaxID=1136231 RepID=H8X8G4_CANO9|nr:hypothetical protein CORT_0F02140 [Candida orthopsilosis Co 90-125]CCG24439.1 hypothetical protein CORT_0F02140 [Candida orthopsilosis Co 90-125]